MQNLSSGLASQITQCDRAISAGQRQNRVARDLAHFFFLGHDLRSRFGERALYLERRELPVHSALRADALHNLLADIAALGEIQRTSLAGFLWQVALADVPAKLRSAACNAEKIQRSSARGPRARCD